ncbi:MAG: ATP phosphoribosyltransferase regulatory subunit [Candidatus Bathyarchaeota archaeon]|nr:MAG: ATP phosphoribosyltransferase regulatory subunit [Candidatus Bathyarchaeota archaeon]
MGGITFIRLQTPKGTKDYLPPEVERQHYVEQKLKEVFKLWGYQEIRSPAIELVEVLSTGVGTELIDNMFKFQDFDGKIVALRAEMTAPVARIVSTKMLEAPKPIRLFYISNVFRYNQSYLEREREFWQAGVELIGSNTPETDGEVLSLLASSLRKLGLEEVRIDVGHAGLLKDLLRTTGLNKENKQVLQNLLRYRDENRLEKFMDQNNLSPKLKEAFIQLSRCRRLHELSSISLGPSKRQKTKNYMKALLEVKNALANYGVDNLVFFDFSLARKIEYYTGIVFEASVPNLGLPLGGGGRYDNLLEKFGKLKIPATGFAVEIEKCLQALTTQRFQPIKRRKTRFLVTSKFKDAAIRAVKIIRGAGVTAFLDVRRGGRKQVLEYAKLSGINYVVFADSSVKKPAVIHDVQLNVVKNMTIKAFLQSVKDDER